MQFAYATRVFVALGVETSFGSDNLFSLRVVESSMMSPSADEIDRLRMLEEGLWRANVRFDAQAMEEILSADFFEFGRSGRIYRREDILAIQAQEIKAVLPLIDFKVRLLDANIAQTTYISVVTYDDVEERGLRSSIWSRSRTSWQLRFHQGTPTNLWLRPDGRLEERGTIPAY